MHDSLVSSVLTEFTGREDDADRVGAPDFFRSPSFRLRGRGDPTEPTTHDFEQQAYEQAS